MYFEILLMFCIVTALKEELQPFLRRLQISAPPESLAGGVLYKNDRVHLLQAGLGPALSAQTLGSYLEKHRPAILLNAGLAGALTEGTEINRIYRISDVINSWNGKSFSLGLRDEFAGLPSARLITVEEAVTDRRRRDELVKRFEAHLVDMEAYALAETARQYDIPFYGLKIVSDFADEDAVETVLKKYKKLCNHLAQYTLKTINVE